MYQHDAEQKQTPNLKDKQTGCKRQTYQIRVFGIHQNWEKNLEYFYWMKKVSL